MAKKAKLVKKRKYTKRSNKWRNESDVILDELNKVVPKKYSGESSGTTQQAASEPRASTTSYVFIAGNKTFIRNLSDEYLNNQYEQIITESNEMRRQLSLLESLQFNMSMEQRFRGLK